MAEPEEEEITPNGGSWARKIGMPDVSGSILEISRTRKPVIFRMADLVETCGLEETMSRLRSALYAGICLGILATATSFGGQPAYAQAKDTLNVVQAAAVNLLEPDFESVRPSLRISSEIVESITKYDWDGKEYKLVPGLAEKWEQTGEFTWRFHLRPGIKFTNGEPLTAEAVKFTQGVYMENKRSGPALVGDLEINVVDELTFDVVTKKPNLPTVPAQLSFLYVYPPEYFKSVQTQGFGNAPIGTGPYMLADWVKGVAITLKANPSYWGKAPAIQTIVYRSISDNTTRVAELQAGSADVVADIAPNLAPLVQGMEAAELKRMPSQRRIFFFLNARQAPTDNAKVRQAVGYAIDRESIVKSLLGEDAVVLNGIYLPGELGYDAEFKGYQYDPEKAKALLAEAGFKDGITLDLHFTTEGSVLEPFVAEAVQAQLAKVGITATLDGAPQSIMAQKYGTGESSGMNLNNYAPIYADSSFLVSRAYFSSTARYGKYLEEGDTRLDELGAAAIATTDVAERQKLYAEAERHIVMEKAYWVPLYQLVDSYGVSKQIDWEPRPDQNFVFENSSIR